jgi:hypothetical protein
VVAVLTIKARQVQLVKPEVRAVVDLKQMAILVLAVEAREELEQLIKVILEQQVAEPQAIGRAAVEVLAKLDN